MSWNDNSQDFNPFAPPPTRNEPVPIKPTVQSETLNDYNPFESQPAVIQANYTEPKKPEPNNSFQAITNADLERRQKELEDRANELTRREEEQRRRYMEFQGTMKNFPPLPTWFPMKPCFYQEIDVEIPTEYRPLVRWGFYIWMAYCIVMLINIFGTLTYMISQDVSSTSGTLFGMSLLLFLLFVPASYICWFRSLYKAFRSDSSFNFFMFFFIFFAQLVVLVIQVLGINVLGSCGWINSLTELRTSAGVGIFMCIIAACFTTVLVAGSILIFKVHRVYRSTGASFEKAKAEFSRDLASNPTVQATAAGVGSAAVSGALNRGNKY